MKTQQQLAAGQQRRNQDSVPPQVANQPARRRDAEDRHAQQETLSMPIFVPLFSCGAEIHVQDGVEPVVAVAITGEDRNTASVIDVTLTVADFIKFCSLALTGLHGQNTNVGAVLSAIAANVEAMLPDDAPRQRGGNGAANDGGAADGAGA